MTACDATLALVITRTEIINQVTYAHASKCPICCTVQSGADLIAVGARVEFDAVQHYLGFSCIGRLTGADGHVKGAPPGKSCNWTLGGLLQMHELEVITENGERHPHFEPASPTEAQAHQQTKA